MGSRFGGENDSAGRFNQGGGAGNYGSSYDSYSDTQSRQSSGVSYSGPIDVSDASDGRNPTSGSTYGGVNQNPASPSYYPPGSSGGAYGAGPAPGYPGAAEMGNLDANYKFSPAETAVVKECARESFYYRSLPLMTALSTMAHFAVKGGTLRAHPKYGSFPKVAAAALVGYGVGKISYFSACQEKFLQLPESRVGDAIRRRRQGSSGLPSEQAPLPSYGSWPQQPSTDISPQRTFGGYGSPQRKAPSYDTPVPEKRGEASSGFNTDDYVSSLDIDSEKNSYFEGGQGDDGRPSSLDSDIGSLPQSPLDLREDPLKAANYDDLRKQHRDAYLRPAPQPPRDRNRPL